MVLPAERNSPGTLVDVIDRVLDKGLIINADISISVVGTELLSLRIRAALASFETAARFGLEFPAGTRMDELAWQEAAIARETCPQCHKRSPVEDLLDTGCPWCGWVSAKAKRAASLASGNGHHHQTVLEVR